LHERLKLLRKRSTPLKRGTPKGGTLARPETLTACWISLLFGQSYRESQAFYALLGLPFYKDPGTFYSHRRKIARQIATAKPHYLRKYRKRAFNHTKNRDNFVMVNGQKRRKLEVVSLDGSWNTRGWHAFDCITQWVKTRKRGN